MTTTISPFKPFNPPGLDDPFDPADADDPFGPTDTDDPWDPELQNDPDEFNASLGIRTLGRPLVATTFRLPSEAIITESHVKTSTRVSFGLYKPAVLGIIHVALDELPPFVRSVSKGGLDIASVEMEDCEMKEALVVRKDELYDIACFRAELRA